MFMLKSTHRRILELQKAQNGQSHAMWVANCHHKDVSISRYVQEIRKLNAALIRKNYTIDKLMEKVRRGDTTLRSDVNSTGSKLMKKKKSAKTVVLK